MYFGLYPEDFKIEMSDVIKLWIAEGFIKANRGQSLEEVAEIYFNDLVDRNLILRHSSSILIWNPCSIHDLVRDLCVMIGEKEKFFCVQRSIDGSRHFIADQTMTKFYHEESYAPASILDPVIVLGDRATPIKMKTRLLRVLCCNRRRPCYAHEEVNMRFLEDSSSNNHDYLLSSLVSQFWSLQTLILKTEEAIAPAEIWKMSQLRHIHFGRIYLPPPPPHSEDNVHVLQNLQTLRRVYNLAFTEELCKRIPNINELRILYISSVTMKTWLDYHLENLGCFNKLESLYFDCYANACAGASLHNIKFPSSLKELRLSGCKLEWSYMAVIASLPHLQNLSIGKDAFAATEWIFVDEKFVSLKDLRIHFSYLTKWVAESSNFPVLEKIFMSNIPKLDEIPSGIGEISTLQEILLWSCGESVNISAVEVLHKQESFENLGLRLLITFPHSKSDKAALLREKIEELGLTCQNLKIEQWTLK